MDSGPRVGVGTRLGASLHELTRSKLGLAVSALIALFAAAQVMYSVSIFPPSVEPRSTDLASASTHVLVDTPRSTMTDLRQDVYEIRSLSQRAVILGNITASPPVRAYIAKQVGIPVEQIVATGPLTPEQPRAVAGTENAPQATDILERPDQYRLSIQANPTVPVLDIYAEAPDAEDAARLADGAVTGLRQYLAAVAEDQGTPVDEQVRIQQLGEAQAGVINHGAGPALSVVVFVIVFALCSAAVLTLARVRRGWSSSAAADRAPQANAIATGER